MFPGSLRTFHAVVKAGSITRAAKNLGLAASSVSRQIAIIERQIGTTLLERSPNGVDLTYAGALVAEYAARALADFDNLRAELNDTRGTRRSIRLAIVESAAAGGITEAIASFRADYPMVSFIVHMMPAPAVVDAIKSRDCEVGITFSTIKDSAITNIATVSEPVVMMLPKDHILAGRNSVALKEIASLPVALPERGFAVRDTFEEVCIAEGVHFSPVLESNTFEVMREFVRCGGGAAILPYRAAIKNRAESPVLTITAPALQAATLNLIALRQYRTPRIVGRFIGRLTEYFRPDPPENKPGESRIPFHSDKVTDRPAVIEKSIRSRSK